MFFRYFTLYFLNMVLLKNTGYFFSKNLNNILNVTKYFTQNYVIKNPIRNFSVVQKIPDNFLVSSSTIISYKNTNPYQINNARILKPPCVHYYSTLKSFENHLGKRGIFYNRFLESSSPLSNLHPCYNKVSLPFFQYSLRNSSSRSSNIQGNLVSLKSKKRIQRKKINLNDLSEMGDERFQMLNRHYFLTFDPDFAFPFTKAKRKSRSREFEIVAFATAEEYDLQALSQGLHKQGLYIEIPINNSRKDEAESIVSRSSTTKPEKVLHFGAAYQVTKEPRTMHIFHNGVIVFWNMPSLERNNIIKFIKSYQSGGYEEEMVQEEVDSLVYTYTTSPTKFKSNQNLIQLNEEGEKDLEKFTLSNVLAMSVKLGIWEASLERYIESIEHVTEAMQESGVIVLNQKQVLQRLGELFALRHFINLSSDLLDTPDFYWDHEQLEMLYNQLANHLSIRKRTSVMNTKLSHCSELMELLSSHLHEKHSSRLEWIIIILIMIEVFFEVLHYV